VIKIPGKHFLPGNCFVRIDESDGSYLVWTGYAQPLFTPVYGEGQHCRFWWHPQTGEPFLAKKSAEKQLNGIRIEIDEGYFNPKHWTPDSPMSIRNYAQQWLVCIDKPWPSIPTVKYNIAGHNTRACSPLDHYQGQFQRCRILIRYYFEYFSNNFQVLL